MYLKVRLLDTQEWSSMASRQMDEEHELRKGHVVEQTTLLKSLMEQAQAGALKELEGRHDR